MAGRELAAVFRLKDEASDEFERMHGHIDKLNEKLGGIPGTARAAMVGLAGVASAAIALGGAAFALGEAFDDASDTITIKSGAMGEALDQLNEDFENVVKNVPTSFQDAADAIGLLHARTGETGEALQALAEQILNLSRLTKTDVGENVRQVTRFFGDWSVATEEQGVALDKLFRAAQMSGQSVSALSANVVQFGAPLRQLGVDMDTAISLFAKWEREGVNVETVAATMRQALARMAEAGLDPATTFDRLINTIHDMEDPIEATTLAMEVFGKRGGADMAAAIREGRFAVDDYKEALEDAAGSINDTADKTDDAKQRMEKTWNELKVAAKPIVEVVFEGLNAALEASIPLIQRFAENMKNVGEAFKAMKEGKVTWQEVAAAALGVQPRPGKGGGTTLEGGPTLPNYMERAGLTMGAEEVSSDEAVAAAERQTGMGLTAEEIARLKKDKEDEREAARIAREAARAAAAAQRELEREQAAAVREAERLLAEQERQAAREAEIQAQRANAIREAGLRLAQAKDDAEAAYDDAVHKANLKANQQIHETLQQFNREQDIAKERQRLQEQVTAGLDALRERQAAGKQATSDTRADEDLAIRRAREDADLLERRAKLAQQNADAEKKAQDAINAARFGGDSRQVLAAMLAAEQARKQRVDQTAEEDRQIALRRQREDEDIARSRQRRAEDVEQAKKDAKEMADAIKELNKPLETFNQQIMEDNLASKIQEYAKAKRDALEAAGQMRTRREDQAESQYGAAVERANNIGVPQTVILNNYNTGLQGPETIEDMVDELMEQAAQRLALTGA